ncbi:NADH:flavin oxidoreductase [Rothia sp. AR01]|uniref:NADH:flavin oxidoreductase n=1 Tax=Rothia santali TaxID=2949643 RepID=A0A9X2KJB3_9MICC|nr:NADH:flavin oxidoreductase [Rothia santali]MCP3426925.1 NADH:flavin oxidoreductase [Rothia santali]
MTDPAASTLFQPYQLGSTTLRNRAVLSPMTRVSAEADGTVTEQTAEYYRIFAAGDFGTIITEGSFIDAAHSQTYLRQAGMATERHVQAWRRVTAAVHREGANIIAQLQHSGPQGQGNAHETGVLGPSAIPARGEQLAMYRGQGPYPTPMPLDVDGLTRVREAFVASALRAQQAGFDGVEIHGANGYLLDAFLTDYLNHRDDNYGGSAQNRIRLSAEIARAVRTAVGPDFTVGIRISQGKVSDLHHKWTGGVAEAATIFTTLAETGLDYLHVTEHIATEPAFPGQDSRSLAQLAREFAPNLSIIANGSINTSEPAHTLLEEGAADLVAIGMAALSNRDWPLRVLREHPLEPAFSPRKFGGLATVQDWELDADAQLTIQ